MKARATSLAPPPERLPYITVVAGDAKYWLRVPSLLTVSLIARAIDSSALASVLGLASAVAGGQSLMRSVDAARQGGPQIIELLGCLIGTSWVDPVYELETERPTSWSTATVTIYGCAVFEELHEAGWTLSQELALGLALIEQIGLASRIEEAILEKARFFGKPRGTTSAALSTPSAPSSADDPALSES